MDSPSSYRIVICGELSRRWDAWFDTLAIDVAQGAEGEMVTTLSGPVADQAALRGMLCKLWDLNLTLLSVNRLEAGDQEETCPEREKTSGSQQYGVMSEEGRQ